jgi:hypothetical protein
VISEIGEQTTDAGQVGMSDTGRFHLRFDARTVQE